MTQTNAKPPPRWQAYLDLVVGLALALALGYLLGKELADLILGLSPKFMDAIGEMLVRALQPESDA